jgi:diacylglycerol kinase family enzyme
MSVSEKWFAIVNPVAGSGGGLRDWPQISKLLRDNHIVPEFAFTERKYHATELAVEAIKGGYRKILVVGGDGTIH